MGAMLKHLLLLCLPAFAVLAQDLGPAKDDPLVPKDRDTVLRIQIFLDRNLFGPGKLDGAIGEFTYKAVVNYNYAHGHRDLYNWSRMRRRRPKREVPVILRGLQDSKRILLRYVNEGSAGGPEEQAKSSLHGLSQPRGAHRRALSHGRDLPRSINPGKKINALKAGDIVVVPNVRSFRIEEVKPMQSFKTDADAELAHDRRRHHRAHGGRLHREGDDAGRLSHHARQSRSSFRWASGR
jgi:hypothetical protein